MTTSLFEFIIAFVNSSKPTTDTRVHQCEVPQMLEDRLNEKAINCKWVIRCVHALLASCSRRVGSVGRETVLVYK